MKKATILSKSLSEDWEKYGVPKKNLLAMNDNEPSTDELENFNNGETVDIKSSINEIERVFLYFSNEKNNCKYSLYRINANNRGGKTGQ